MQMNDHPSLIILLVTALGYAFSPAMAAVLAPYLLMLFDALVGAAWGLKRRTSSDRKGAFMFVLLMLGTALIFTMPFAVYLQKYTGENTVQWLLAPIALLIGAVGESWPSVGAWLAGLLKRLVLKWAKTGADQKE